MTIRCKECGSADVQMAMWVRPNFAAQVDENRRIPAIAVVDDYGSWDSYDTKWCTDCEDHVLFINDADEDMTKTYRIFNRRCWKEDGTELFWSNQQGWVDRSEGTVFTRLERNNLALPFDGEWVEVDDAVDYR